MRAALIVLLFTGCASTPCPIKSYPKGSPFLWEVAGSNGSLVIQATHQAIDDSGVSPRAWQELNRANLYVAEADEAVAGSKYGADGDWRRAFFIAPGSLTLRSRLSQDEFDTLVHRLGAPQGEVMFLKPWIALVLLGKAAYDFPEHTINRALLEHARAHRIATEFLESWEQQVLYLDESITPRKLASAIHDFDNMHCRIENSVAAFNAGEDAAFANDVSSGEAPILARLERWHGRLVNLLESGRRVFVAVGIGQLVGPSGLLTLLAADGYRVRRI